MVIGMIFSVAVWLWHDLMTLIVLACKSARAIETPALAPEVL